MTDSAEYDSFVGVDVGGTNIKVGWVRDDGRVLAKAVISTDEAPDPQRAIRKIMDVIGDWICSSKFPVRAIGLGTPGPLDLRTGRVLDPVNLPNWGHFSIRDELAAASGRPVTFSNDANAAAFGEFWLGAGRDCDSLVLLTLGTGVGTGIVLENRLITGATGHAAECGHCTVDFSRDAPMCGCGQRGHLEACCSATAVSNFANYEALRCPTGRLGKVLAARRKVTALDVCHAAEAGDDAALAIVDQTAEFLIRGIVNLAFTLDPQRILLGGAMDFGGEATATGRRFIGTIREGIAARVFSQIAASLTVDYASLGSAAGWIGAAGLAKRDYDSGLFSK